MLQGLLNEKISNQNIDRTESYYEEIKPSKDMVVTYADDGMILDIKSPNTIQKDLVKETTDVYGIVLPEGSQRLEPGGLHQINCILIGVQIGLSGREERLLLLIQKDRETIQ